MVGRRGVGVLPGEGCYAVAVVIVTGEDREIFIRYIFNWRLRRKHILKIYIVCRIFVLTFETNKHQIYDKSAILPLVFLMPDMKLLIDMTPYQIFSYFPNFFT